MGARGKHARPKMCKEGMGESPPCRQGTGLATGCVGVRKGREEKVGESIWLSCQKGSTASVALRNLKFSLSFLQPQNPFSSSHHASVG